MKLAQLFSIYPEYLVGETIMQDVKSLTQNSGEVEDGSVFVAVRGHSADGHKYIPQAIEKGASGLVVEKGTTIPGHYKGAVVFVEDTRAALHQLANFYFAKPAEELFCVGITGTNGKTSTSYMIENIFTAFGWPTGVMGTINHHLGDQVWKTNLTTPDSIVLYKRLREMAALGAKAVAFEVSSHALSQSRVDEFPFDVGVFTNLTRDHLDYHKTMEEYFAAKQKLFTEILQNSAKKQRAAVINIDDQYGKQLRVADGVRVLTYGRAESDLKFRLRKSTFAGSWAELTYQQQNFELYLPLPGLMNLYNATAAIAVGVAGGASVQLSLEALAKFSGVPGRLQQVPNKLGLNVFVDYAHTDDALRSVLKSLDYIRQNAPVPSRIITVFGCGGDRDQGKRPLMLRAALEVSDLVFATSDNPRSEDPNKILDDILQAAPSGSLNNKIFREVDRKTAIARAIQSAASGDVVLIAGKGHENYQIVGQDVLNFSDFETAKVIMDNNHVQP